MADLTLETTATIPTSATVTITVSEDSTADGTADASASQQIADGTNTYTLSGFDGAAGNDVWFHLESDHTVDGGEVSVQSVSITAGPVTTPPVTRTAATQDVTLETYGLLRTLRTALVEPTLAAETHVPTFEAAVVGTTVAAETFVDLANTARVVTSDLYDHSHEPTVGHAREAGVATAQIGEGQLIRATVRSAATQPATPTAETHARVPIFTAAPAAATAAALAVTDDPVTYAAVPATATVQRATSRSVHTVALTIGSATGDTSRPTPTSMAVSPAPTTTGGSVTRSPSAFTTALGAATVSAPDYRRRIAAAAGGVFDIKYVDGRLSPYRSTATPPTTTTAAYTHRPATTRSVATETAAMTDTTRTRQPRTATPLVTALTLGVVVDDPLVAAVVIAAPADATRARTPFVRVAPTAEVVDAQYVAPTYTLATAIAAADAGVEATEESHVAGVLAATAEAGGVAPEQTHVAGVVIATATGLVYVSDDMLLALEAGGDTTLDTNPRSHRVAKFKNR